MKTKLFLALVAMVAFAASSSAQVFDVSHITPTGPTISNAGPSGGYFFVPGAGNAAGFAFAGGPFVDAQFDGATENIGADAGGGFVNSSDSVTVNGDGTINVLLTLVATSGDFVPAGTLGGGGAAADTLGIFAGASGGGTPFNWGGPVNSAFLDVTAGGTSIFGAGAIDLIPVGFDIESGSFGISLGAGTAGVAIDTITLDVNITKAVPEPTSVALLGVMGVGLFTRRRR